MNIKYSVKNIMENHFKPSPEQEQIIYGEEKIKKVIACAGSGKTSILTASIVNILKEEKCLPSEILALTFTKNAALNMQTRISKELSFSTDSEVIDIFTFNSFGNQIIRENSYKFGLSKNFSLLNEAKSWQIIFEIFRNSDFEYLKAGKNIAQFTKRILESIWNIKNNLVSFDNLKTYLIEYESMLSGYKSKGLQKEELNKISYFNEICRMYAEYEKLKLLKNCIDYADQIFMPYRLFNESVAVKEKYQQKYKFIFVDEFQDTNNSQAYLLAKIFDPKRNSIMIVGDDDQGIYGFRGASVENIMDMGYFESELVSDSKPYFLTINFRSGEKIINFANNVISNNKERNIKIIKPEFSGKESEIFFFKTIDMREEAIIICEMIKKLREKGIMLKDIAILCRKKKFGEITRVLNKENIRYEFIGNKNLFYENEILFLLSWLKLINNIYDEESLMYLLKSSKYKISDRDIYFLKNRIEYGAETGENHKKEKSVPVRYLLGSLKKSDDNRFITKDTNEKIKSFLSEFEYYIKKSEQYNLSGIINLIFHHSGLYDEIKSGFGQNLKKKIKNIESLIRIASDFEQDNSNADFEAFVIYLKELARTEVEDSDSIEISGDNAVKIMSIHAAKGLEFKIVFLPMLRNKDYKPKLNSKAEFELPAYLRTDSRVWSEKASYSSQAKFREKLKDKAREEERRIFYVAASRAEKLLVMSHPLFESYQGNPDQKSDELLEFVREGINDVCVPGNANHNTAAIKIKDDMEVLNNDSSEESRNTLNKFSSLIADMQFKERQGRSGFQKPPVKKRSTALPDFADKENAARLENKLLKDIFRLKGEGKKEVLKKDLSGQKETDVKTRFFTLTEILSYLTCPKLYELRYLINIPENTSRENTDFGTKIHKLIADMSMQLFKAGNAGEKGFTNNEYEILLKEYDQEILSIKNEKLRKTLSNLTESNVLDFREVSQIFLEELFYWKVGNAYIRCQIDRADIMNDGSLRIYDYKSGSQKSSSGDFYYKNQIKFYLIAASEYFKIPVEKAEGLILYLGSGDIDKSRLDLPAAHAQKAKIPRTVSDIILQNFDKKPVKDCTRCSYSSICK